jgi:hypothetical protein
LELHIALKKEHYDEELRIIYGQIGIVRYEVFRAVTLKNAVFWDVTPCDSCWNRRFEERTASIIKVTS